MPQARCPARCRLLSFAPISLLRWLSMTGKDLRLADASKSHGFWRHTAVLHAASVEDGARGHAELKDVIIRDYNAWTLAAALLATVGLAALLVRPAPLYKEELPFATYIAEHLYVIAMATSSMLSLSCVNDFVSVGNFFNMVPAPYVMEARVHLYEAGNEIVPLTKRLQKCGLGFGSAVFYQSIAALLVGILIFLFLTYGAEFCIAPAMLFTVFWLQIREYNRGVHWDDSLLPVLAERKASEMTHASIP